MFGSPPEKPFKYSSEIYNELKMDLLKVKCGNDYLSEEELAIQLNNLYTWLCATPKMITYRINVLKTNAEDVVKFVKKYITESKNQLPCISTFIDIPELVMIHAWDESIKLDLKKYPKEIIVDGSCGSAVLRGAHIFAPGVMSMSRGICINDKVSIYADIAKDCKKGLLEYYPDNKKVFIGNGIAKMSRKEVFAHVDAKQKRGVAIEVTDVISRLPQLNDEIIPNDWALLQNLPSIFCTLILNPQPGEIILDMCAAPGNKTTHISNIMKGKGILIALEKNKNKIYKLRKNCKKYSSGNVKIFCYDSTKAVSNENNREIVDGPPFKECSFDRILLDGPCSGLGQRPQLYNSISVSELRSYVLLQKQLFFTAARLLKPNGVLVYSTCTITVAENEGIVAWALRKFPSLHLTSIKTEKFLKDHDIQGYCVDGLTEEQSSKICRFGYKNETNGFFIARFVKQDISTRN